MTTQELEGLQLPLRRHVVSNEGEEYEEANVTLAQGVATLTFVDGRVFEISTTSSDFPTGRGARVGTTVSELARLYPEGRMTSGFAEGGYLNFVLEVEPGIYQFSTQGLTEDCLVSGSNCPPDLDQRSSTRFFIQDLH